MYVSVLVPGGSFYDQLTFPYVSNELTVCVYTCT